MSVKIKLRGNGKAIVKFDHPVDEQYFSLILVEHRDDGISHPKISIKNKAGRELPSIPKKIMIPKIIPSTQIKPISQTVQNLEKQKQELQQKVTEMEIQVKPEAKKE